MGVRSMGFQVCIDHVGIRELIRNLTVADLKNRYQDSFLGFFWSFLSPFLLAAVLYFRFWDLSAQENYALHLIVGIMVWRFFSAHPHISDFNSFQARSGNQGIYTQADTGIDLRINTTDSFITGIP